MRNIKYVDDTTSFWPDQFISKTDYLESLKGLLESGGVYDFKL